MNWKAMVLMSVFAVTSVQAAVLKIFVLTGQSNSLGTLKTTDTTMLRDAPGRHAVEQNMAVPFFWDNTAGASPAEDAALGDSGGMWVDLGPQTGGVYAGSDDHWGPEIGFARMVWNAGYRDFGIVKASRGGGGNTFWVKDSTDDHMYVKVTNTVVEAVGVLPPGYDSYEIVGLLYVQGESNNETEAAEADTRFSGLLTNLKADLPQAANLTGVLGEIGGPAGGLANRDLTRTLQKALADSRSDIGYASSAGTVLHDPYHYTADSQLLLGERMAAEMIHTGALGSDPLPAWTNLHAWYVADNAAQLSTGGSIDRWGSLADGGALPDLFSSLGEEPDLRSITVGGRERKILNFDGSNDLWVGVSDFGSLAGDRSVAVLCRVKNRAKGFLFDGATSTGRTRAQVRDGNWQVGVSASGWDVEEGITEPVLYGKWQRHVFVFSPSNSTTEIVHWINGVQAGSLTDPSDLPLEGFVLGACGDGSSHLSMEVAEVAMYEKRLNASEVLALENVWQDRWGSLFGVGEVIPYTETFESYADGFAMVGGAEGWSSASPTSAVVDCDAALNSLLASYNEACGYPVYSASHTNVLKVTGTTTHFLFNMTSNQITWVDYMALPVRGIPPIDTSRLAGMQAAIGFDLSGHPIVWCYDWVGGSNRWAVAEDVVVPAEEWVRMTVMLDYQTDDADNAVRYFQVRVNGNLLTNAMAWTRNDGSGTAGGHWFAMPFEPDRFLEFSMETARDAVTILDDLVVTTENPLVAPRGTPFDWLTSYGMTNGTFAEQELLDGDDDGRLTWQEWVSDTDPVSGASVLRLTGVEIDNSGVRVNWKGGVQATQVLERCTNLVTVTAWTPFFTNLPPTSITNGFRDLETTGSAAFYRIKARR